MAGGQGVSETAQPVGPQVCAPRLVGRDAELALLRDALDPGPGVVVIEGEGGVGKSRLVQEFLAGTAGAGKRALVAGCPPFRLPCTLGPVIDAVGQALAEHTDTLQLSALAGALRPLLPEWSDRLPEPLEPAEDASAERHRLFRAVAELLALADVGLLVVEDAHWADDATLDFPLFLVSQHPLPLSLVVTHRREDTPPDSALWSLLSRPPAGVPFRRIALEPLDEHGTALLISSMVDDLPVSEEFARLLHDATDGVPLAVEESMRLLDDRADVSRRDGEWIRRRIDRIAVPPTVRDAVLERVGRLDRPARRVLAAVAVIAQPCDAALVAEVLGPDAPGSESPARGVPAEVDAGLGQALASGLLAENGLLAETGRGGVAFRHALAARAVYDAIPAAERRALHRGVGRALAERPSLQPAVLAEHFRLAGELAEWRRHGEHAADIARATGDVTTSEWMLHDLAVHSRPTAAELARLVGKISFASLTGRERFLALADALRAALAAGGLDEASEAEVRRHLGRVLIATGDFDAGRVELELAAPHLVHDPLAAARTMIMLGLTHGSSAPASTHLEWIRRAALVPELPDEVDRLGLLVDRASLLLALGEEEGWPEADRIPLDTAVPRLRMRVTRGNLNIGDQAIAWGRYAEARRRLDAAYRLAEANHYTRARGVIEVTRLHLDYLAGRWSGLAERARRLGDADGLLIMSPNEAVLVDGLMAVAVGDLDRAVERLTRVAKRARQSGATQLLMEPTAALAGLHVAAGRFDEALAMTEDPVASLVQKGVWFWGADIVPVRVAALLGAGRDVDAASLVERFATGLGSRDAPAAQGGLLVCRALLAESAGGPGVAEAFVAAAEAWSALPRPYAALQARERSATWRLGIERDCGLDDLTAVARELAELGATADAERVGATLRAHGVAARAWRGWRGGSRGYGDQLSPRELEVARLVVAGRTNKEIAEQLVRSRHTVESQVQSAMRKLGVSSRTALAVAVTERGL